MSRKRQASMSSDGFSKNLLQIDVILSHVCEGNNENTFCYHVTLYHNKVFWNNWNTVFAQLLTKTYKNSKFVSFWSILSFWLLRQKILEIKNGKTLNLTTGFFLVSCNYDPQQICHTIIARPLGSSTGCTFRNTGICNYKDVKSKKTALKLGTHINWPSFYDICLCWKHLSKIDILVRMVVVCASWNFCCTWRFLSKYPVLH